MTRTRYAAVRLDRQAISALINKLTRALNRKLSTDEYYHDTMDVVVTNEGEVTFEDDGIILLENGEVLDYGNENVNALA